MSSSNSSYISNKLKEENEIRLVTENFLKSRNKECSMLNRELYYQLQDSLKAQNLYQRVLNNQNLRDYNDHESTTISGIHDLIKEQKKQIKSILKRLNQSLLQSLTNSERLECLHKRRRLKQILIYLKEMVMEEENKLIHFLSIPRCPVNFYRDKVGIRIIGCDKLNRAFTWESVIAGFPENIQNKITDEMLDSNSNNLNVSVKCDLIINHNIVFTTITQRPSHHCWNQTFEFFHDFGNLIEFHVTWISPYRSLDAMLRKYYNDYRQLDFMVAGCSFLTLDDTKDRGFISRVMKLYPNGNVFFETFIKPKKNLKPIYHNHLMTSLSRSVISPSSLQTPKTSVLSLHSDFKLRALIGTGHFGKIILCQKIGTKELYAVKALRKAQIIDKNEYAQILEEKKVLRLITKHNHPFLVHLFACLQDKKYVMFLLEFVEAGDLATLIYRKKTFSDIQTKFYSAIIVLCLEFLHDNNIIYRDLKMENLLIDKNGFLKLVDFGLSKTNMNKNSKTSTFCGTIDYMAPEVLTEDSYTRMVDWWALGVVIYYMITGEMPFDAEDETESLNAIVTKPIVAPPNVKVSMASLLLSLLDRNPSTRLGSQHGAKDIKTHTYFKSISFSKILSQQISPPFIPELKHSLDLSYFDSQFTKRKPTLDSAESVDEKMSVENSFFDNFCL